MHSEREQLWLALHFADRTTRTEKVEVQKTIRLLGTVHEKSVLHDPSGLPGAYRERETSAK